MMTNKERYMKEINSVVDYKITINEFIDWIAIEHGEEEFIKALDDEDIYTTAVDYSIPIILIKYFKRVFEKA